ncbi:MAG: SUMF1/EgtB/PvdO family nonheme iron enzyme [Gemmatimonadota bacterium]
MEPKFKAWGELILAALVVVALVILVGERFDMAIRDAAGPALPPIVGLESLSGVRPAAWYLPDDRLLGFVEITDGRFLMGSDPQADSLAYENEFWPGGGQATVDLPTYYIGRTEVTIAQFRAFLADTRYAVDPAALDGPPDHPVASVTWPDALAYARWLDGMLRNWSDTPPELARALDEGARVTLPDEAEWEKAARGTDGRIFPWGNDPVGGKANFQGTDVAPVGSVVCAECAHGLADMSGNVWEWTRSPFQPYPYDPAGLPLDLQADALWVMRGGSFSDGLQNVRAATRGGADPGAGRPFIGFRVAISAR